MNIKWEQYGESLNNGYQHWGHNIKGPKEVWNIYNFGKWLYKNYGLRLGPDEDSRTIIMAENCSQWMRFYFEWSN